jgi:O-antigen/teichoic acid export membrane protein
MEWVPGVAILVVSVSLAVLLGSAIQLRSWASYVGLIVALVLLFGWLERRRDARPRPSPRPSRTRSRLKVIEGGRDAKFDLSKDDPTDPKYVM